MQQDKFSCISAISLGERDSNTELSSTPGRAKTAGIYRQGERLNGWKIYTKRNWTLGTEVGDSHRIFAEMAQ